MNIRFRYDLEKKIFVNASGVGVAGKIKPEIAYGMKPVWEWEFINSAGEPWDISNVAAWRAAIDTDFRDETAPMCRTLGGITVVNNVVHCPMDALTTTYRDKANGRDVTNGFFDLTGFDAAGVKIFYFRCPVACLYVLDPEEVVDPLDPPETTVDAAQVEAIAQGVVNAALAAYTPPDGEPGPIGPAPRFEFSATGIAGTWHATWAPGDLYLRVSTDLGVTWQGPVPLGTQNATFPLVPVWSDEVTYATGALVAYGTPAGLYQAKEPVGYDQSPEDVPAKWQQVAGPGADGASSMWLMGSGAPTAEIGNDHDQYLDELYNHYRKVDGAWVQMGSIKGANGAGINHRGAWSAAAAYSVGDGVTSNGSVWSCTVPHTGQEPPATPEGLSLYWELFLARGTTGNPGPAGTVQIVAVNMLAPTADPYASEGAGSTAARRLYTLNLPRGSTGPAGSLRIEMGLALEPDEDPVIEELPGSTPHNRSYRVRLPMGQPGERGTGMNFNATGTFAGRVAYDGADGGFCYLATDVLTDDLDHHYQAMYYKVSDAIGDWSDAIRLYAGQPGDKGGKGDKGDKGDPGENAAVKPAQEFIADDLYERTLIVAGTDPIATVDVYDVSGHAHALALGTADGEIAITTRADVGHTLVTFGPGVDLTYGGRIRFAQGLLAADGGSVGPALSDAAPAALADTATPGTAVTAARADHAHPTTGLVKSTEKGAANGVAELGADGKVPAERLPTIPDAGPALSNTAPVALAAAASAGSSADAARADHAHPTTGLATLVDGKVPAEQLPEASGGIDFSTAVPLALASTAAVGTDAGAAHADHVHPTTGLVETSQIGVANGVAGLDGAGLVPLSQLPEVVGGAPEATNAQVATAMSSYYALSPNKYITINAPVKLDADIAIGDVSFKQMTYPEKNAWFSINSPIPPRLVFSPYMTYSYAYATSWGVSYPRCVIVKLTEAEALDMAFITWWKANRDSNYPTIDMNTGEVLFATGNSVVGYEWDKLNVVAAETPHDAGSGYVSYDKLSQAKQRYLYENSTAYTGTEGYHGLAEAYAGKWVLCRNRNIIGTVEGRSSRTNFVDSYGHAWPDVDMPGQAVDRIEFEPLWDGWVMPSWSENELNSDSIPTVVMGQQLYEFNFEYIGGGVYQSTTFIKSEISISMGAGADSSVASALETPLESSRAFYLSSESDQVWGWCSKLAWSGLKALLASIAQIVYKVYETRTLSRFNSYLRLKPPQGASAIEVRYSKVEAGTVTETESLVNIAGTKENRTYVCNLTGNEANPRLLRYVDISGNDCTKEDANTVLLNLSGLPPEVDNVAFRWYYSPELCTKWLNTPVQVADSTIIVADSTIIEIGTIDNAGSLTASGVMEGYPDPSPYPSAIWSVDGGTTWNADGSTIQLPAGTYTLTWGGAGEYNYAPASSSVTITAGQTTTVIGTYTI